MPFVKTKFKNEEELQKFISSKFLVRPNVQPKALYVEHWVEGDNEDQSAKIQSLEEELEAKTAKLKVAQAEITTLEKSLKAAEDKVKELEAKTADKK